MKTYVLDAYWGSFHREPTCSVIAYGHDLASAIESVRKAGYMYSLAHTY